MVGKLARIGAALIVSTGLVAAVGAPAGASMSYRMEFQTAATVLAMGGLGYETVEADLLRRVLGGRYAGEENLVGLPWPGQMAPFNGTLTLDESVTIGLETMDAAIRDTPGMKIVAGASGSTLVVNEMMRRLAADPTAPPTDEITFVVMGDADRGVFTQLRGVTLPIFDYTVQALPETGYDVLVVAGEYDGLADWPDRSWNLLAVLNALAGTGLLQQVIPQEIVDALGLEGFGSVHYDAMFADLAQVPGENITTTVNAAGGLTTTYLVPTPDLPLLRPLRTAGVPQGIVDTLEAVLRPVIDSAYVRNDPYIARPNRRPGGAAPAPAAVTTPPAAVTTPPAAPVSAPAGRRFAKTAGLGRSGPAAVERG